MNQTREKENTLVDTTRDKKMRRDKTMMVLSNNQKPDIRVIGRTSESRRRTHLALDIS